MAGENPDYLAKVRKLPCLMSGHGGCTGEMHAHHPTGRKGIGQRNHDRDAVPLCAAHHTERHGLSGTFKGWRKEDIRRWESEQAAETRRLILGAGSSGEF